MPDGSAVDVSAACPILRAWDLHMNLDSRGAALWQEFMLAAQAIPDGPWAHGFSPDDPLHTPNTLNTADPQVRQALASAVQLLQRTGVPLDVPLGEVQYQATSDGTRIPIHGGNADVVGVLNDIENGRTAFTPILVGSSFVMAVQFTSHGPQARTILTFSESANPQSPFAFDQTRLF